jgi:hypothetical protein
LTSQIGETLRKLSLKSNIGGNGTEGAGARKLRRVVSGIVSLRCPNDETNHAFMTTFFLIAAVLYSTERVWLRWGVSCANRAPKDSSYEPTVTVIAA